MPSFLSRKKPQSVYGANAIAGAGTLAQGGQAQAGQSTNGSTQSTGIPSSISAPTGFTHVAHVGSSSNAVYTSSNGSGSRSTNGSRPNSAAGFGGQYDAGEAQRASAQQVAELYRSSAVPTSSSNYASNGSNRRSGSGYADQQMSYEDDSHRRAYADGAPQQQDGRTNGGYRASASSSHASNGSGTTARHGPGDFYNAREPQDNRSSASSFASSQRSAGLSVGTSAQRSSSGGTTASSLQPEPLTPPPLPHQMDNTATPLVSALYDSYGNVQQQQPYLSHHQHAGKASYEDSPISMDQSPNPAGEANQSGVMTPSVSSMGTLTLNSPPLSTTSSQRKTSSRYALGDFDFIRTLGTGSFGRVHLVRSRHNARYYAVKVLSKERVVKMKQVEHTNSEREMLERVRHPFLVNLWGTFKDTQNLYMVMDFVSGGELFSLLRKSQRFPDPVAKFFAAEVALALDYLHSLDIIYRDLKPENILLAADGHVRLADFGFARYCPDVTWTLCGTPDYLAPEIVQSKGYNKSVDWYALGILMFEMLAGYPPFFSEDSNPMKLYEKIIAGKVRYPSHFGASAKDLIKALLSADLSKRLGNLANGSRDIFGHTWFVEVDWERLYQKAIPAPYVPQTDGDGDFRHFDTYAEIDVSEYGKPGPDPHGHLFPWCVRPWRVDLTHVASRAQHSCALLSLFTSNPRVRVCTSLSRCNGLLHLQLNDLQVY